MEQRFVSRLPYDSVWLLLAFGVLLFLLTQSAWLLAGGMAVGVFVVLGTPNELTGALVVGESGLRIEPRLGGRLLGRHFVQGYSWAEIRHLDLELDEEQIETLQAPTLLSIVLHDGCVRRLDIKYFGSSVSIIAALREHFELDPQPLRVHELVAPEQAVRPPPGRFRAASVLLALGLLAILYVNPHTLLLMLAGIMVAVLYRFARRRHLPARRLRMSAEGLCIDHEGGTTRCLQPADVRALRLERCAGQLRLSVLDHGGNVFRMLLGGRGLPAGLAEALHPCGELLIAPAECHRHRAGEPAECTTALAGLSTLGCIALLCAQVLPVLLTYATAWHADDDAGALATPAAMLLGVVLTGAWWAGYRYRQGQTLRGTKPCLLIMLAYGFVAGLILQMSLPVVMHFLIEAGWRSERHAVFRLVAEQEGWQTWVPRELPDARLRGGKVEVSSRWANHDGTLVVGRSYRLVVWRGGLGTLAFPPTAFRDAERVRE